ncbi:MULTISPECIES: hypothetical protein [unclassified Olleya]|jgi:uncharacterized membrane protein|uniref:hypothetical protein n=1 Tax=unclassified Olleya TaxID=2615019 RepID=UPI0011A4F739|nr:hypothetical protein [Olleya sp. Hel_I_94]TVZ46300.1 hypothetical protein JM82_0870 [Olleya sp. Hel_I_94]
MFKSPKIYYFLIVIGAVVAIYANANEEQNILILIIGIIVLMFGLFKVQATIPSKREKESFVETESSDEK